MTPAVGSLGALHSIPFPYCSLTNSTRYRMDSQIAYDTSLRGYPFTMTLLSGVIANILISVLMGTSLTYGVKGPVDQKCAPVPTNAGARMKSGMREM